MVEDLRFCFDFWSDLLELAFLGIHTDIPSKAFQFDSLVVMLRFLVCFLLFLFRFVPPRPDAILLPNWSSRSLLSLYDCGFAFGIYLVCASNLERVESGRPVDAPRPVPDGSPAARQAIRWMLMFLLRFLGTTNVERRCSIICLSVTGVAW